MLGLVDAAGNNVLVALDDDREHTIQIDSGRKTLRRQSRLRCMAYGGHD